MYLITIYIHNDLFSANYINGLYIMYLITIYIHNDLFSVIILMDYIYYVFNNYIHI